MQKFSTKTAASLTEPKLGTKKLLKKNIIFELEPGQGYHRDFP